MSVFGSPSQKYSGIIDLRIFQELLEKIEKLEKEGPFGNTVGIAYRAAVQKVPTAVFTRIAVDTAISDPNSNFDLVNGWYVVPSTGYYQVNGNWIFKAAAIPAEYAIVANIYRSGLPQVAGGFEEKVGAGFFAIPVSGIILCNAGEHIELMAYQASGGERELFNSPEYNQLSIIRVA